MNTPAIMQPKAFILKLPNELLDNIASLLLTEPSALSKLSQTCLELETISRPIIFKSFSKADGSARGADHGLKAFLESIQQNAKLGRLVRNLNIKDMRCSKDVEDKHHCLFSAFTSLAPKSLGISNIAFRNSGLGQAPLTALLTACKELTSFSWGGDEEFVVSEDVAFGSMVDEIQYLHGDSIERIGYFAINLWEQDSEDCREYLRELEKDVSVKFPKLRKIGVWIYDTDLEGFDEVIDSFAGKGIIVDIEWTHWSD